MINMDELIDEMQQANEGYDIDKIVANMEREFIHVIEEAFEFADGIDEYIGGC